MMFLRSYRRCGLILMVPSPCLAAFLMPNDLQFWRLLPAIAAAGVMRYPDGGGLTAQERARREKVRLAASGTRPS